MSKYAHLTPIWVEKYNKGASIRGIAKEYDVCKSTVKRNIDPYIEQRPISPTKKHAAKWKELYELGWSQKEIATKYKVSQSIVAKRLSELGVASRNESGGGAKPKFDKYLDEWVKLYEEEKKPLSEIARQYNCSVMTVSNVLSKKIEKRSYSESSRNYNLNETYFNDIDSKEKAYWLGFIFASGSLVPRSASYAMQVVVAGQDKTHIQAFAEAVSSEAPIFEREDGVLHTRFYSKLMFADLEKHGLKLGKWYELDMPVFNSVEFVRSFILGYMDGKSTFGEKRISLEIAGPYNLLSGMNQVFKEAVGISLNLKKIDTKENGQTRYQLSSFSKYNVIRLLQWLYCDQPITLKRKEDVFHSYFQNFSFDENKLK